MSDTDNIFDLAIVGLGALGSAAACWAARRGATTIGLDQFELGHDHGASEDHSRIIRRSYPAADYLRFAHEAFSTWAVVEDESGEQLVVSTGGLDLFPDVSPDDPVEYTAVMRAEGTTYEVLGADEVMRRWPAWRIDEPVTAIYQEDGGIVAASRANAVHRRLAEEHGARLVGNTPVRSIAADGDGYALKTDAETYRAGSLIVVADAWTNRVLAPFGVQVPLRITQEQVVYFEAADPAAFEPDVFPVWIWHQIPHAYGIPSFGLPGPKVALHGGGPEVTPETRTFEPDAGYATAVESFVREHLPGAFGPILEIRTCQYARTPDDDFVLDLIPGQARAAFALGTAHAFKFSSAIGRALVDLVLDGTSEWRLPRFAADRPGLAV